MVNPDRETRFRQHQQRRSPVTKGAESLGEAVAAAWRTVHPQAETEYVYVFPDRQANVTKWYSPALFSYFPNPLNLDLYRISQDRVEKAGQNGKAVYNAKRDARRYGRGRAVVRTEHVSELVKPGYLNSDDRVIRVGGLDGVVSEIWKGGHSLEANIPIFRKMVYEGNERELFTEDGRPVLLHEQFGLNGILPSPLPEGATVQFFDGQGNSILEATALPIPKELVPTHEGFIGPEEKNNLDAVMIKAREKGGRILVVYKVGKEGIIDGFIQADPGVTDVYEVDEDKKTVKKLNGKQAPSISLPPVRPGNLQVVEMSIKGKIETFVRGETDAPEVLPGAAGVYGIDEIELGNSSAAEKLVPVHFRDDGAAHVNGSIILAWQREYKAGYSEYLKSLVPEAIHGVFGDEIKLYLRYIKSHGIIPEESAEERLRSEGKIQFLDYVRVNAIMPVQPVMIQLRRIETRQNGYHPEMSATIFPAPEQVPLVSQEGHQLLTTPEL